MQHGALRFEVALDEPDATWLRSNLRVDVQVITDRKPRVLRVAPNGDVFLAETGGAEEITLTVNQIPSHTHPLLGSAVTGDQISPSNTMLANSFNVVPYINDAPNGNMAVTAISGVGGSQPHTNFQPYLCLNFIISLFGIFPSPT